MTRRILLSWLDTTSEYLAIFGLCLCFIGIDQAYAVDCHAEPGGRRHWSWRQVEGRKCWYQGPAGMDKRKLRWRAVVERRHKPLPAKPKPPRQEEDQDAVLLRSYWPVMPEFEKRWNGEDK